jgi:hypothetical protein
LSRRGEVYDHSDGTGDTELAGCRTWPDAGLAVLSALNDACESPRARGTVSRRS